MALLHSWAMLVGVAAVGLPLAIHWLTRPRPVRLPISTLRFIQEVVRQRRAAHRLRDLSVLGLRALAVLLLGGVFARPLLGPREQPLAAAPTSGDTLRVVILDTSASMSSRQQSIEVFERARSLAASYLAYAPGLRANLILAGARPNALFERPSGNVAALREELARIRPAPEQANVQAALRLAAPMLSQAAGPVSSRRELLIVSDFQRTNWQDADFSFVPADTCIQLESVAPANTPPNLAVLRVASQDRAEQGAEIKIEAEVGNFSPTPRQVQVQFSIAGAHGRVSGLCPANGRATLSTGMVLREGGWPTGEVRIVDLDDALPADNVRPFVLDVRPPSTYALITRQPEAIAPSASYYLERALVPAPPREGRPGERVIRIDPAQLDAEALAAADLLVLAHPGKLDSKAVEVLVSCVSRGRSLLYVADEAADASNLALLSKGLGPAVHLPVEFLPAAAAQPRRDLRLTEVRRDTPVFALFGDGLSAALAPLRFAGGLASRPIPGGLAEGIWATYGDRSAFLVVVAVSGEARLAVINADLAASNLPASPMFVPLVNELAASLLGHSGTAEAFPCGQPVSVSLPAAIGPLAGLQVVPPSASDEPGALVTEGGAVRYQSAGLGGPGIYRVTRGEATCFALASAVPPEESDLRCLDPSAMKERFAGAGRITCRSAAGPEDSRDTLWVWLAVGCMGCLLLELIVLKVLRT